MPRIRVVEARESRDEVQLDGAGGTVALFGQDNLRLGPVGVRLLFVAVVVGLAVNEGDYIGVLLDGA